MAVPQFTEFFNPLLESLQDGEIHSFSDCKQYVKNKMQLTEEDLAEMLPSKAQPRWINRVSWGKTYLLKAGVLCSPRRGYLQITLAGKTLLTENIKITPLLLKERYQSFSVFVHHSNKIGDNNLPNSSTSVENDEETPQEIFDRVYRDINSELADEILTTVHSMSPQFFERLVVRLMEGMGYGGYEGAGFVTKTSHDNGIDGMIDEDKLGFNRIYIQAKRWAPDKVIQKPDIQQFKGALEGPPKIEKGLYITTAQFSKGAREYAEAQHIILVDGKKLAELMIEFDVGVSTQKSYKIKRIDSDFFNEDE